MISRYAQEAVEVRVAYSPTHRQQGMKRDEDLTGCQEPGSSSSQTSRYVKKFPLLGRQDE